ncbi:MAG: hypothetical protein EPN93_11215 [Spirochaetes bacterium]|nr:MAG: hypothetical protein EPN93_11215 [Spirochaetota bacterium]
MNPRIEDIISKTLIIVGILVFSTLFRLYSLDSDPPDFLSWSAATYIDEGYKSLDARNVVKFGTNFWSPYDQYRGHVNDSRLMYEMQLFIFENFGMKVINLRYMTVWISELIIAILLVTLAFFFKGRMVFFTGLALSINVVYYFHSKVALYELPMLLLGTALMPLLFVFLSHRVIKHTALRVGYIALIIVLIGLFTGAGMNIKESFLIYLCSILAAFFFASILPYFRKRNRFSPALQPDRIFLYLMALIGAVAVVLYLWGGNRYVNKPLMLVGKIWFLEVIYLQPNTFLLAVLSCIAMMKVFFNKRYLHYSRAELLEYQIDLFFTMQLFFSFMLVYLAAYSPLRYFLFSEISIVYLAARFAGNYDSEMRILTQRPLKKRGAAGSFFIFLLVFYIAVQAVIFFMMLLVDFENRRLIMDNFYLNIIQGNFADKHVQMVLILILMLLPVAYYFARHYDEVVHFIKKRASSRVMVFLLIQIQLIYLLSWEFNKTSSIREAMNFVNTLPAERVIIGDWAPMLALESDLKIIYSNPRERKNMNNIPKLDPDYVVANSGSREEEAYNSYVPGLIKPENVIYAFKVQSFDIKIYKVDKKIPPRG